MITMFDCSLQLLAQFVDILPMLIALFILFDFIGSFFFGKS